MKTLQLIILLMTATVFGANAQGYGIGDKAADFKLKNIDGSWVSLADYDQAKGFIVIFTCNHCPYAVAYEDRIIDINEKYADKGYPVIAINPNDPAIVPGDSYDNMKIRAKEKGFKFPYLFDEKQEVFPEFGATRTPHIYVLNKEGNDMIVEYIGAIDDNYKDESAVKEMYLVDAVEALLKGEKPETTFTKAIGCSIKQN